MDEANSEAVYGTSASVFERLPWGRCTTKPGKLYLHVFDWPKDGKLMVPGLKTAPTKAYLLTDAAKPLTSTTTPDGMLVLVPAAAPDPIASVVVLEVAGKPEIAPFAIKPDKDGKITLLATDARLEGPSIRLETMNGVESIGYWVSEKGTASWDFTLDKPGPYRVEVDYACEDAAAGGAFRLTVADGQLESTVPATGAWNKFKTLTPGKVIVGSTGKHTLTIAPKGQPKSGLMNVRAVRLVPETQK